MTNPYQLLPTLEALIFSSPKPIGLKDIIDVLQSEENLISSDMIEESIKVLEDKYNDDSFGFQLVRSAEGYKFVTKEVYYPTISKYVEQFQKKRLSKSALETLSIIAFRPNCTKAEIEAIRGVGADYALEKLIERELIEISGKRDSPGQPATYITTSSFLEYFGLTSLEQLPKPNELKTDENAIGES